MPTAELVSLLIPTYQGERYLAAALDSALAQDWPRLEIIVSDDGSSDGTLEIAREYQARSPYPFEILHNPVKGMVNNWNHCIANARGSWIKFLFQDDLLAPDCVRAMMGLAARDEALGLVFSPRTLLTEDVGDDPHCARVAAGGQDLHKHWPRLLEIQSGTELLASENLLLEPLNKIGEPTTVLIRAEAFAQVGSFDASLAQIVDFDMWARIMARYKVGFIDRRLSSFRIHPGQATVSNLQGGAADEDMLRFLEKLLSGADYAGLPSAVRHRVVAHLMQHLRRLQAGVSSLQAGIESFREQRDRGMAQIRNLTDELNSAREALSRVQDAYHESQQALAASQAVIARMASSRFWRLRRLWLNLLRRQDDLPAPPSL